MLGQLAAQCWLSRQCIQQQVVAALSARSSSAASTDACLCFNHATQHSQQQTSAYHTSCSSSSAQQPLSPPDSAPSDTTSASTTDSPAASASSGTDAGPSASASSQHIQQQTANSSPGFATLPSKKTASGYPESRLVDIGGAAEELVSAPTLPEEQLRIQLRQETMHEQEKVELDAYSLSRSLVGGDRGPAAGAPRQQQQQQPQQQQQQLTATDKETLEKLVGIMTKDGKKSRARRQLLDAMHIIKQQLAQGKNVA